MLQKWVVKQLLNVFPSLTINDIRSTSMGVTGADIQLSQAAKELILYSFECKNQEVTKGVYDWYDQSCDHNDGEPVVIIKRNHREPLVVVSASHFIKVISSVPRQ